MGTHSIPWPFSVSTSFFYLHITPSLTSMLLLYRHTPDLVLPKLLYLLKPYSLVFPCDHDLILSGYSHFLAPASTLLVLTVPGSSSSPSFPRSLSAFSWLQFLLIFPAIHHFNHCLVNTLNPTDLCFPTALILGQSKHSSFLLCMQGAECYWGQSTKHKDQNPINYRLFSATPSTLPIHPSVGPQYVYLWLSAETISEFIPSPLTSPHSYQKTLKNRKLHMETPFMPFSINNKLQPLLSIGFHSISNSSFSFLSQ